MRALNIRRCLKVKAGIRLLSSADGYFIEFWIFSARKRYKLLKKCYPVYRYGVFTIEVCADPTFDRSALKKVKLSVDLCAGVSVFGEEVKVCWKALRTSVSLHRLPEAMPLGDSSGDLIDSNTWSELRGAGVEYVCVEYDELSDSSMIIGDPISHGS